MSFDYRDDGPHLGWLTLLGALLVSVLIVAAFILAAFLFSLIPQTIPHIGH